MKTLPKLVTNQDLLEIIYEHPDAPELEFHQPVFRVDASARPVLVPSPEAFRMVFAAGESEGPPPNVELPVLEIPPMVGDRHAGITFSFGWSDEARVLVVWIEG